MLKMRELRKGDDLKDLVSLSRLFFIEYEKFHKDYFKLDKLKDKDLKSMFVESLKDKNSKTIVAIDNEKTVGYIIFSIRERPPFYKIKKRGHVSALLIHKDYRRKGIAARLLDEAKKWFKSKGVKYFDLETSINNLGAVKFYSKSNLKQLRHQFIGEAK